MGVEDRDGEDETVLWTTVLRGPLLFEGGGQRGTDDRTPAAADPKCETLVEVVIGKGGMGEAVDEDDENGKVRARACRSFDRNEA